MVGRNARCAEKQEPERDSSYVRNAGKERIRRLEAELAEDDEETEEDDEFLLDPKEAKKNETHLSWKEPN